MTRLACLLTALALPAFAQKPPEKAVEKGPPSTALALNGKKNVTIVFTGDNGGEVAPCG